MTTIVYQEIQTCLEPLVFKHKFAPPKPNPSLHADKNKNKESENKNMKKESFVGLSFLQSLTTSHTNTENVYVHPLTKKSSTNLSKQSLDMCTESLGSETGNFTHSSHGFSYFSSMKEKDRPVRASRSREFTKKLCSRSYPPPLSSACNFQVRPHRENGRLVIRVTTEISQNDYFHTERKNGRLKLSLLKETIYTDGGDEEHGNEFNEWVESVGGNSGKVGGEIENRPNRCKGEGSGKSGISSLGPFLVATS